MQRMGENMTIKFKIPMVSRTFDIGEKLEVEGSMIFSMYGLTFAAHRPLRPLSGIPDLRAGWVVSETSTGHQIRRGNTRREAVLNAKNALTDAGCARVHDLITDAIGRLSKLTLLEKKGK